MLAEKFFLQLIRQEWVLWTWIELSPSCPTTIPLAICSPSSLSHKAMRTLLLCQLKISSNSTVSSLTCTSPESNFHLGCWKATIWQYHIYCVNFLKSELILTRQNMSKMYNKVDQKQTIFIICMVSSCLVFFLSVYVWQ